MTKQNEVAPVAVGQKNAIDILAQDENYLAHKNDFVFEKSDFYPKEAAFLKDFASNDDDFDVFTDDWIIPNDISANDFTIVYARKTMKNNFLNFLFSFVVENRQDKVFIFVDFENSVRTIVKNGLVDFALNNANFKHLLKSKMWGKENEVFDSFLGFNKEFLSNSVFVINKLDVYADKQKQIDRLDKLRDLGATIILVVDHKELDLNSLDYVPDVEVLEASKFF